MYMYISLYMFLIDSIQCILFYITHLNLYCYFIIITGSTTTIENAKKAVCLHSMYFFCNIIHGNNIAPFTIVITT